MLFPLLVGAVVAVGLGVFGRLHDPAGQVPWQAPFPSIYAMKVWLTLAVLILAAVQLVTAVVGAGLTSAAWYFATIGTPT